MPKKTLSGVRLRNGLEDRSPGEPFVPKSSKEAEMERILKSMEGMPGAPGMKMYSRDDLMNMQNFGNEDADEDEDEEDDEARLPSKLGKLLRKEENAKVDWKRRITRGMLDAREAVKHHAYRVYNRIRQWWKQKKAMLNKKSSKDKKAEL